MTVTVLLPTATDLQHLREWTGYLFFVSIALAAVALAVVKGLDWLADRDARRIKGQVDEQAERRFLQAVTYRGQR